MDPHNDTIAARGGWVDPFTTRPSNPPIYQTTAFDLHGLEQLEAVTSGTEKGYVYTRDGNPNHEAFAMDVAKMEGAETGMAAASGMGAMTAVLMAMLRAGDHVVAARVLYGRTSQLLNQLAASFNVAVTYVDANQPDEFHEARKSNTKLAIVESISNPLMEVADLPRIVAALGPVPLLVDSTFATPCLLKPIEHGATLVFHSASKYLNGHGDVMLGVVAGPHELVRKIRGASSLFGVNPNPFEAWLGSRGLRTLPLRMARVSQTALEVAKFLKTVSTVSKVFYPGLEEAGSIAKRMLPQGCGGMLAFELSSGRAAVEVFFKRLAEKIPFSPTLADARSTLSYPAGTSHKFISASQRAALGITDGLVRVSIGLEDPADLLLELSEALDGL